MRKIKKLLVANRGEITMRVMRSAREMGIKTVAVYSEADRNAMHVRFADEAVCLGAPPSNQSYLLGDKIIEVCKQLHVDAIHPGYGFLSENAAFARKVREAGLIFVGPSPESIEIMGDKISSKQTVKKNGKTPLVPGMDHAITDIAYAKKRAIEIGYPVLIKATAGGGGKGMRIVENEAEFDEQMERAMSEAKSAFGNGDVFLEKFITSPKHIEVQVIGDQHGNVVHLFERECSIQRRHQKLVEEAPSSCLTPEVRQAIGEAAVAAAKACNYYSAGTVEFVVDENLNFYFLEMNTRLQVEHPVSELITGMDLVKEQIRVAEGEKLSVTQDDLKIHGHAMEIRVCAEDPLNNFLPDVGKLLSYKRPQGVGIRVDDGFEEGMEIPIYYDSMIAKLITYAKTREDAIERMIRAIDEYEITGVKNTLNFCRFVMQHEAFRGGKFNTKFIEMYYTPEVLATEFTETEQNIAAVLAATLLDKKQNSPKTVTAGTSTNKSKWKQRKYA